MFFPFVDALRAFAALSVLVYHLIAHWDWTDFPTSGPLAWFRGGWMAVDVFFVISGFVIGLSAFERLHAQGPAFRGAFMRSRLARIVPLHYLTLAAWIALVEPALVHKAGLWPDLASHLLFVHNASFEWHGSINGPNWSLATEMQFYVLMVVAAPWLARARPLHIALVFAAIAWLWRWGAFALLLPGPLDRPYMAQTQLPGMLDEFAIGLLLARFVRAPLGQRWLRRVRGDARLRWSFAAFVALCWWALLQVYLAHDYWEEAAMAVFFRTGVASCAALALWLSCAWPAPRRAAPSAAALYLGKISYGIYLWHLPVLFVLGSRTQLEPLVALAVAVPATVALAALTWHGFEQPLLRLLGKAAPRAGAPRGAGLEPAAKGS